MINIVTICHIDVTLDMIGYIYIIWNKLDAIHSNCIHKLHINGSSGYSLDQSKLIAYSLNKNITIVFSIVNYYEFFSNVHKMDRFYPIINKIQDFGYNCMDVILSITDALSSICYHKLHTIGSCGCELNKNGTIQYTPDDTITTMITIIKYDKFATSTIHDHSLILLDNKQSRQFQGSYICNQCNHYNYTSNCPYGDNGNNFDYNGYRKCYGNSQIGYKRNNFCKVNKSRNTWCIPTRNKTIAIIIITIINSA